MDPSRPWKRPRSLRRVQRPSWRLSSVSLTSSARRSGPYWQTRRHTASGSPGRSTSRTSTTAGRLRAPCSPSTTGGVLSGSPGMPRLKKRILLVTCASDGPVALSPTRSLMSRSARLNEAALSGSKNIRADFGARGSQTGPGRPGPRRTRSRLSVSNASRDGTTRLPEHTTTRGRTLSAGRLFAGQRVRMDPVVETEHFSARNGFGGGLRGLNRTGSQRVAAGLRRGLLGRFRGTASPIQRRNRDSAARRSSAECSSSSCSSFGRCPTGFRMAWKQPAPKPMTPWRIDSRV
jgi:hypothetical protein